MEKKNRSFNVKFLRFTITFIRVVTQSLCTITLSGVYFLVGIPLICSSVLYGSQAGTLTHLEAKWAAYYMPSFAITLTVTFLFLWLLYGIHKAFCRLSDSLKQTIDNMANNEKDSKGVTICTKK